VYAIQEAAYHLQRAIALHERALAPADDLPELHTQLGDAYTILGQHETARQAYATALAAPPPEAPPAQAALLLRQAKSWLAQYELDAARERFNQIDRLLGNPAGSGSAEWRIWLDARLEQFDVAYYAANLAQMAALVGETEPLLEQHGDVRQRIRFYQTRAQWHSRQTRFRHTAVGVADAQAAWQLAQADGDEALIHASRFALGFMLLWQAQPDPAAATVELAQAAAGSRATGNVPLLDRCLAYLSIAYRLQGDVAQVEALLPQSMALAESEENWPYLGVAGAHRAWLAARARRWNQVTLEAQAALAQWQKSVFPFHWLACWPALAAAVETGDMDTAVGQAQAMLAPEQQKLPEEVIEGLETAVVQPTPTNFQHALTLARQHKMV
jgi:eukaryotic-like serine/threonine-protein kinase